jgi:hypothetical protein
MFGNFGTVSYVGRLFGMFSDVGRLVMGRLESGTFCAVGHFEIRTFQEPDV